MTHTRPAVASVVFTTGNLRYTCSLSGGVYSSYLCDLACKEAEDTCLPDTGQDFTIGNGQTVADHFTMDKDHWFEQFGMFVSASTDTEVTAVLYEGGNNHPNNAIGQWNFTVGSVSDYVTLFTGDECLDFYADEDYWLALEVDDGSEVIWQASYETNHTTAISDNDGLDWSDQGKGPAGGLTVWGEEILSSVFYVAGAGDVNADDQVNVRDGVMVVDHLLGLTTLSAKAWLMADVNYDDTLNTADLVELAHHIVTPPEVMTSFLYEDLNPNSTSFSESVGPEFFRDQISLYYFGKAG